MKAVGIIGSATATADQALTAMIVMVTIRTHGCQGGVVGYEVRDQPTEHLAGVLIRPEMHAGEDAAQRGFLLRSAEAIKSTRHSRE